MSQSKVFNGIIWASVQRFGTMFVSFVANIVLARLLTPDDFGTVGILLFFVSVGNTFVDGGFGNALIQKQTADDKDFSTVFFSNLGLSILIYGLLFICSPLIAQFYHIPILCPLLRVQSLFLLINAFCIIQTVRLRKQLDFKILASCNLVGNILGSFLAIISALEGMGVWSLAIRTLGISLFTTILLWIRCQWKPRRVFSMTSFKELFGFGGYMLLSSVVISIYNNFTTLLMGKLFSSEKVGYYTQANNLKSIVSDCLSSVVNQVLYPDFSNMQNDNRALRERMNLSIHFISFFTVPVMCLMILVAQPLISLLYGPQWESCVPMLKILCLVGIFYSPQDINYNAIAAKGKSKTLLVFNTIKTCCAILILFFAGKYLGLYGLVWSLVLITALTYLAYSIVATSYIGGNLFFQLKQTIICMCYATIPFFMVLLANHKLQFSSNIMWLLVDVVLFLPIYAFISYLSHSQAMTYILGQIFKNHK